MKTTRSYTQISQNDHDQTAIGENLYAKVKITNTYKSVDPGAWIRIRQKDGTFRFVWDKSITNQDEVNDSYGAGATIMGKTAIVNATDGINYALSKDGICRAIRKGVPAEVADVKSIKGKSLVPEFHSGTYTGKKLIKDDVYENIKVSARFSIPNLSKEETENLKWIQVLYGPEKPHRAGLGTIDNKIAFVDGGINSPKGREEPWYGNSKTTGYYTMEKKWEQDGFRFTLSDFPGAIMWIKGSSTFRLRSIGKDQPHYSEINFESYVVLPNYRNSGKIKIVGVVKWGFQNDNWELSPTIPKPEMIPTDKFSPKAQEIWDNDYGSSDYKLY